MAEPFITITSSGFENYTEARINDIVQEELNSAYKETMKDGRAILRKEIRESGAVATGNLLNSVTDRIASLSVGQWAITGEIYFRGEAGEYVVYADSGRAPGKRPPGNKLLAWMRVKGIDDKYLVPIQKAIAERGTDVSSWKFYDRKPFMEDAAQKVDKVAKENYERAMQRVKRRLDNAVNNSQRT
jgi:hypothetical protein